MGTFFHAICRTRAPQYSISLGLALASESISSENMFTAGPQFNNENMIESTLEYPNTIACTINSSSMHDLAGLVLELAPSSGQVSLVRSSLVHPFPKLAGGSWARSGMSEPGERELGTAPIRQAGWIAGRVCNL